MKNIKILNNISPVGLQKFNPKQFNCGDNIENPDAFLVRSAPLHDVAFPKSLKAIARAGAGVNNIPIERCSEQGIVVFNTPGANANAVKELVILGLLLSARKVFPGMQWVQSLGGSADEVIKDVESKKSKFTGPELKGKRLGIIGLGNIGRLVANMCLAFGMEVYGYDPYISVDSAWCLDPQVNHVQDIEEIYRTCDFISLHIPATEETKGFFNKEVISKLKDGARILNFARGELVNETDMLEGLESDKITCYITDFPTANLIGHKGVVVTPHIGASTPESEENCAIMAASELIDFLNTGNVKNSVNMPTITMGRTGDFRITVIHKNKPNMLQKILKVLSDNQLNVANLTNKSRGDYAYTIVDLDGTYSQNIYEEISAITDVIKATVFL